MLNIDDIEKDRLIIYNDAILRIEDIYYVFGIDVYAMTRGKTNEHIKSRMSMYKVDIFASLRSIMQGLQFEDYKMNMNSVLVKLTRQEATVWCPVYRLLLEGSPVTESGRRAELCNLYNYVMERIYAQTE